MRKNVASQTITAQLVAVADGEDVTTGTTTVYTTIDGGTQDAGVTAVHKGNGCWSYAPSQALTNGDHIAFTFVNTAAISITVNVYPVSFDYTDGVRLGITALPNAAADGVGGLPISDAGGLDMDATDAAVAGIQTDLSNGVDGLGALKALIDTVTTNVGTVDTVVDGIQTDLSNATDGLGVLKALIDTVNTDLSNPTDGLGALKALLDGLFTTALVESYNADGSPPTVAQALFVIMQALTEFAITSTTVTVKKLDGSTTAFTGTLDNASSPTSQTRST